MTVYSDVDDFACAWLQSLIDRNQLAPGEVWNVDIRHVQACPPTFHAFAGIGGWPLALQMAGWPPDTPVWTGSCPCQPFSVAGKKKGQEDDRHLWPDWLRLIRQHRPTTIFGEQVASPDGRNWLATVFTDLEALGYAVAGADLCAAGAGAPHTRQRLFFVAHAASQRCDRVPLFSPRAGQEDRMETAGGCENVVMAHANGPGLEKRQGIAGDNGQEGPTVERSGGEPGFWEACDWLYGQDGYHRPIEPGLKPVADGVPDRMGLLKGYGNAIVPQVAAHFIRSFLDVWA